MATNNSIDSLDPIQVALGGTGNSTLTSHGVLYGNGTAAIGATSSGTSTQLLTSNGAGVNPSFQNAPSSVSGNLVFISQLTAANSASLVISTGLTYNNYYILMSNVVPVTNAASLYMYLSTNGGSTYLNSGFGIGNGCSYAAYNSTTYTNVYQGPGSSTNPSFFYLSGPLSNTAGQGLSGSFYLMDANPTFNGDDPNIVGNVTFDGSTSGAATMGIIAGFINNTAVANINAIKFAMSSGNISTGTISIYGVKI